jgi:hypothetical protein
MINNSISLNNFIEQFDKKGSIVLLEGKRDVSEADQPLLEKLGELLAQNTKNIVFRSGNAAGADLYFCKGVAKIDAKRVEVITPYNNHRTKSNVAYVTHSLDSIDLAKENNVIKHSKMNTKSEKIIDAYVSGNKNFAMKAAYLMRDTVKVTGTNSGIAPATFAIFYDDLQNPKQGGTGHTMSVCEANNVPYITQKVWMEWVK